MSVLISTREVSLFVVLLLTVLTAVPAIAQAPPELTTVFPSGGRVGHSVDVALTGSHLQTLRTLHSNVPGIRCERLDAEHFRLSIPPDVMPGQYDLWAVGDNGVSAPRVLAIGNRVELIDAEPNETDSAAMPVPLDVVINGRIEKLNDVDHFRFDAKRGQRVVVECLAERIDSRLRAILEIYDAHGRRLAVNRGYFSSDPMIDFRVPADGSYVVKIQDLLSSGSVEHYYRLDIDTKPRVAFSQPSVIERGKAGRVTLYGWNLSATGSTENLLLDRVDVDIPASLAHESWPLPVRLLPSQSVLEGAAFPFHLPGSHAPIAIGLSDVPVVVEPSADEPAVANRGDNVSSAAGAAQEISVPCEVSGQIAASGECDRFAFQARRGEVFFFEALGQRLQSPVDLQISVLSEAAFFSRPPSVQRDVRPENKNKGQGASPTNPGQLLAQFTDEARNIGGAFPTSHLDPAGRWICPAEDRYLIAIRNQAGGLQVDQRRIYRLSIRREEPTFELVAVSGRNDSAGLIVKRGGREVLELFAFRRRGMNDAICVSARDLPLGVDCPDVWLGPGVNHATIVVSADRNTTQGLSELKLTGSSGSGVPPVNSETRPTASSVPSTAVRGGTIVRSGTPNGWGRIMSQIPLAIAGDAPLKITADGDEELVHQLYGKLRVKHSPGGVLDVAVHVERKDSGHQAAVKLIGIGLPESIQNQTATIPAGQQKGYVSFYLPPSLPVGRYSFVVRAETTVPTADQKTETVLVHSNPVVFDVHPAAFRVEVDPFAVTQVMRGETITVPYSANRLNGFIGKMHTELAAAGRITDVVGIRGRGETFTGQTDKGALQIVINEDAPLGRQPFLRLFTVGVVEDQATYFGSSLLPMEIIERTK